MNGKLKIDIQRDAMAAYVTITPIGETEITKELLKNELEERGIKAGIDEKVLSEIPERGRYNVRYCVAKGKPAVRGKDGYYEFLFDTKANEYAPIIRDDGTVDYAPHITMVKSGDKIATYHYPTTGTFGYTIFAAAVAPAPAKHAEKLSLKGVGEWKDDFIALVDGHVTLRGRNLEVRDCLVIEGDAGYAMGRIAFNGDIHVKGDVLTGAILNAYGNIQVDGVVEGAKITAGKDIIIKHGVHGQEKAVLKAGGTITTNFIEEAKVEAKGNIMVDHMINANVHADNTVCAAGKNGQIIGGTVVAESCVDAFQIGNDAGVKTQVVVKASDEERQNLETLIVRKRAYPETTAEIGDTKIENLACGQGEFHLTVDGLEKFEIGKFDEKKARPRSAQEQKKAEEERKPLILLVDDDLVVLKSEYSYLNGTYRVAAVSRPEEALVFIQKVQPDLILLDYLMPKMNGGELLERIRSMPDKNIANVPVFFLTSVTDKAVVTECLKLYPQGYLIKPLEQEELLKIVGDFFETNKAEESGGR
jgi:hypothetical protein